LPIWEYFVTHSFGPIGQHTSNIHKEFILFGKMKFELFSPFLIFIFLWKKNYKFPMMPVKGTSDFAFHRLFYFGGCLPITSEGGGVNATYISYSRIKK